MARLSLFSSPLMLGFEQFEQTLNQVTKASSDGYPPYNIEKSGENGLCITLAVAGFGLGDLQVKVEDNQLRISGRQEDDPARVFLHRGIAARQFQRSFVLADGIKVTGAHLSNGLLSVELERPTQEARVRTIEIVSAGAAPRSAGDGADGTIDIDARSRSAG